MKEVYRVIPTDGNGRLLSNRPGRPANEFDCVYVRASSERSARFQGSLLLRGQGYRVRSMDSVRVSVAGQVRW